jgi:hypothetical protein
VCFFGFYLAEAQSSLRLVLEEPLVFFVFVTKIKTSANPAPLRELNLKTND